MNFKELTKIEKHLILSIPILFLVGTIFHFLYDFSNNNIFIGMFTPVNESVWEHCKMVVIPIVSFYLIYYILNKNNLDKDKWFLSCLVSLVTAIITIPMLYYFYTQAFGTEILIIDILILLLSITFGQLLGIHFYNHANQVNSYKSIFLIMIIILIFIIFTFNPPKLPLFIDPITNSYGINMIK
jgi:hypothetical protein